MRRWISALVVAAFTALVALLGVPVPSAIAVPSAQPFPAYTYDGHDRSALSTTSTPARGPPAAYDHFTSDDAVDRPSRSASARPNRTMASPAIGYDHPTALVRGARATDMTQEHAQLSDGPSVVFDLVGVAANGGAVAVRTGQAGERAVQNAFQIGDKRPFNVLGRDRIADGMTETTISEVKNVAYQGYTQQLKDYVTYSIDHGLRFDLYVRRGTTLSGPLQEAIGLGQINRMYIP